jgi:DNA processing protein
MALGIDGAAHRGALGDDAGAGPAAGFGYGDGGRDRGAEGGMSDMGGGPGSRAPTIAVLPGPPCDPYPPSHRALCTRIVLGGGALSELPPGAEVRRWSFPARNRIIAALATMTVVVEAAERSGSLVTARVARELGRRVGAVPGQVTSRMARGTNRLLVDGACVVRGPEDVLEALFGGDPERYRLLEPPPLPAHLQALLDALSEGDDTARAIASAGFGPSEGVAALAELELAGRLRRAAGGFEVVG